jgi:hypothetical protein
MFLNFPCDLAEVLSGKIGMVQADGAIYKTNFNFAAPARTFLQRSKVH